MENVIGKLKGLDAMLCAITGSAAADELTDEQLCAYLTICQALAAEALALLNP